jgi:predicted RNase H-like HicB family nuclease
MEAVDKTLEYYKRLPYTLRLDLITEQDGSKYLTAEYVELRGCKTDGDTEVEAVTNLQELFDDYITAHIEMGTAIPEPEPLISTIDETLIIFGIRKAVPTENAPVEQVEFTKETKSEVKYQEIEDTIPV